MYKNGIIGNFLIISAKTNLGMTELKEAIFNSNIKEKGRTIVPDKSAAPAMMTLKINKKAVSMAP